MSLINIQKELIINIQKNIFYNYYIYKKYKNNLNNILNNNNKNKIDEFKNFINKIKNDNNYKFDIYYILLFNLITEFNDIKEDGNDNNEDGDNEEDIKEEDDNNDNKLIDYFYKDKNNLNYDNNRIYDLLSTLIFNSKYQKFINKFFETNKDVDFKHYYNINILFNFYNITNLEFKGDNNFIKESLLTYIYLFDNKSNYNVNNIDNIDRKYINNKFNFNEYYKNLILIIDIKDYDKYKNIMNKAMNFIIEINMNILQNDNLQNNKISLQDNDLKNFSNVQKYFENLNILK